jgi:hypothetical protein
VIPFHLVLSIPTFFTTTNFISKAKRQQGQGQEDKKMKMTFESQSLTLSLTLPSPTQSRSFALILLLFSHFRTSLTHSLGVALTRTHFRLFIPLFWRKNEKKIQFGKVFLLVLREIVQWGCVIDS